MQSTSVSTNFPFMYLHAELVRYKREQRLKIEKMVEESQNGAGILFASEDKMVEVDATTEEEGAEVCSTVQIEENEKNSVDPNPVISPSTRSIIKKLFSQGNAETRLEYLGYRVGSVLVEKVAKDLPRFNTELDKMKFICKEFWSSAFGKNIDNLRTNHQGVYIMQDNKFFLLSSFAEGKQYVESSAIYLAFPCGLIRGALESLGIPAVITSSVDILPAVKFHVHL